MAADVRRFINAQTNRYFAAVRKILSIKGEGPDVGFGVHLEDERPEHSFIKGERLWVQWNQVTTAAGSGKGFIGVRNPANSGVVVVVTGIVIEHDTAGILMDVLFNAPVAAGVTPAPMKIRDTRWQILVGTTCGGFAGTGTIAGGSLYTSMHTPGVNQALDILTHPGFRCGPVVLGPNSELWTAQNVAADHTYSATFTGYERSLESGELIPA